MNLLPMKMLSETDCLANIRKSEVALQTIGSEKEERVEMAKIMIWERLLFHVREGRTVTLDTDNRMQLWDSNLAS